MEKNQLQENELMTSLFVTQNEKWQIIHAEFFFSQREDALQRRHGFAGYIHAELEMYKFDNTIPDYHLCRWDFPKPCIIPPRTEFEKGATAFGKFIEENGAVCMNTKPLRLLECASYLEGIAPIERFLSQGVYDQMLLDDRIGHRLFVQSLSNNNAVKNIRAVENDKGVLLFPDNKLGECYLNAYLQHIADNYFYPDGRQYDHGQFFMVRNPSDRLLKELNEQSAFSPFDFHFMPEKANYLPSSLLLNETLDQQRALYRMDQSFRGFHSLLLENPLLGCSRENYQIMQLMHIQQTGRLEKFSNDLRFKQSFSFQNLFAPMEGCICNLNQQKEIDEKLIEQKRHEMSRKAENILQISYGINPSGTNQRKEQEVTKKRNIQHRL